jgi:hypothetical protein
MSEQNPFWQDLNGAVFGEQIAPYQVTGQGHLPSFYCTSDLAEASIGLAGTALARFCGMASDTVTVDRRLASLWFDMTLRPDGWELPSLWDEVAGDYQCADGWIRLHTNARHHRDAALRVLNVAVDRDAVREAVLAWRGIELETAIVTAGGCASFMRTTEEWAQHPQGRAVAFNPLVHWDTHGSCAPRSRPEKISLAGLKVLDLTRVLAGPVATRFLAGFGAEILRIDPPFWNEPSVEMEVTLGKRCAGLDMRVDTDVQRLKDLMKEADVFVHGYRADAFENLGLGRDMRRSLNPHMIDVSLNAYGWSGPWVARRGFDSLVQMSCGIAALGMQEAGEARPVPLPVQALDHATGYLVAACVLEALSKRATGQITSARLSLAGTAHLLAQHRCARVSEGAIVQSSEDFDPKRETTGWGPALRVKAPMDVSGQAMEWALGAGPLRRHDPHWS